MCFFLVVVAEKLHYTTTTSRMRYPLCFGFRVAVKLQVGCGDFRKQIRNRLKNPVVFCPCLFMWVNRFTGCHKSVWEPVSVSLLHCFPASEPVWHVHFSPHPLHGSMQKPPQCECKSMQRLFFSPQETKKQNLINYHISPETCRQNNAYISLTSQFRFPQRIVWARHLHKEPPLPYHLNTHRNNRAQPPQQPKKQSIDQNPSLFYWKWSLSLF